MTTALSQEETFTSVEDAGICSSIDFLHVFSDVPRQIIADAISRSFAPSKQAISGNASNITMKGLPNKAKRYYDIITGLLKRSAGGASYPSMSGSSMRSYPPIGASSSYPQIGGASSSSIGGASSSSIGGASSSYLPMGGASSSYPPIGGTSFGGGVSSSSIGGASSSLFGATRSPIGGAARTADKGPFDFLRYIALPPEVRSQLANSRTPVMLSSYIRNKAPVYLDYAQAYDSYRREMPAEDVRMFGGSDAQSAALHQASVYHFSQIAGMSERYKVAIKANDKILGRQTNPSVDSLTLMQLIDHYNGQQIELFTGQRSWLFNQGIGIGGSMIGNVFNGETHIRMVDRYFNLHTLPDRILEMRSEPWWKFSIQQASKSGGQLGDSPWIGIGLMFGLTILGSIQDGIASDNAKRKAQLAIEPRRSTEPRRSDESRQSSESRRPVEQRQRPIAAAAPKKLAAFFDANPPQL